MPSSSTTAPVGACSWCLRPAAPAALAGGLRKIGVRLVQLALDPIRTGEWDEDETANTLREADVSIASGMMRTIDEDYTTLETIRETGGVRQNWERNRAAASENARLARRLGLSLVTLHAGFIPHDPADPLRQIMLSRLREVIDLFAEQGVRIGFETGQETADTLVSALDQLDRPGAGVNFDPANMILYGMGDPVEALRKLAPRVLQIHIKDANPAPRSGVWGREVAVGSGAVKWDAFFDVMRSAGLRCGLMLEREAGPDCVNDMRAALDLLRKHDLWREAPA